MTVNVLLFEESCREEKELFLFKNNPNKIFQSTKEQNKPKSAKNLRICIFTRTIAYVVRRAQIILCP